MQNAEGLNLEQISEFLQASEGIEFNGQSRAETLRLDAAGSGPPGVCEPERGQVRAYVSKVTGWSLPPDPIVSR